MTEQVIIGVRGAKGERIEVLEPKAIGGYVDGLVLFEGPEQDQIAKALERAWTRYKKIKT